MKLETFQPVYDSYIRAIRKFHTLDSTTKLLEVGTGMGFFPIYCALKGWQCTGLEISRQLMECGQKYGREYGVDVDIRLGNIEESEVGDCDWDVVVASNVFEHVEHWERGLERIYRALKPGGMLWFESTNKFCVKSHEYDMPFYSYMPDAMRYAFRRKVQGDHIMKLGIDFNQFRHGMLRKEMERIGFSKIYDRIEMTEESWISTDFKRKVYRLSRDNKLIKALALTFSDATRFVCIK